MSDFPIRTGDVMGWINFVAPILVMMSGFFLSMLDFSCRAPTVGLFDKKHRGMHVFLVVGQLLGVAAAATAVAVNTKYMSDLTKVLNRGNGISFHMTWGIVGKCATMIMLAARTAATSFSLLLNIK